MRCRGMFDSNYLRDVHVEEGGQGGSLFPAKARLPIWLSTKSDHIQAVVGFVDLWQHIYRSVFILWLLFFWILLI